LNEKHSQVQAGTYADVAEENSTMWLTQVLVSRAYRYSRIA
jgi:hypothetical protein